jgi:competence protein ComEC
VRVTGRIRFPYRLGDIGEFNYQAYLERRGIGATIVIPPHPRRRMIERIGYAPIFPGSQIEAIREHIRTFIKAGLRYPESAEMMALVIGDRGGIDDALRQRFALTGMAHLLVISGLHLSFVAMAAFAIARLLFGLIPGMLETGRANKAAALVAAVTVAAYSTIAGHHISTSRALVMVLSYVLAIVADRGREAIASLALAAIVICLMFPGSSADLGFQLSFASVTVIVLGMRHFLRWWRNNAPESIRGDAGAWPYRIPAMVAGACAVSFWAMIGTAPLTAFYFNQISFIGLIANVVVVPIMGLCGTVCGLIASLLSFFVPGLAAMMLTAGGWMLALGTWLAGWFLDWPLSWTRIFTPTIVELAIAYGLIALWLALPRPDRTPLPLPPRPLPRGYRFAFAALLLAAMADAGWWTWDRYFDPDLRIAFLSVGQGDAAVVRFPGSRVMLVDAGGSFAKGYDPGERIVAPYLWSHKILHVDYLALSHPDFDHFGGFDFIARNFSPNVFWTSGPPRAAPSYQKLLNTLTAAHVRMRSLDGSSAPLKIGGVRLRCLGPERDAAGLRNNTSMVLLIGYGSTTVLFPGDIEAAGERALIEAGGGLHATVLKVPHHGSITSSSEAFLGAVNPELAVISLGYLNRFNFPAPDVIARYQALGIDLLRTDLDGEVELYASRDSARIWTYRHGWTRIGLSASQANRTLARVFPAD